MENCCCYCLVAKPCPILCDPMDYCPPGSSVHGIFQAGILEWAAISFSRGSSWPRDQIQVSCTAGGFFTIWATREALTLTLRNYEFYSFLSVKIFRGASQVVLAVKNLPANAGNIKRHGFDTWSGRSSGGGNGNPLQYSCLENSVHRGAWRATVHRVAKSRTWLSD